MDGDLKLLLGYYAIMGGILVMFMTVKFYYGS